MIDPAYLRECFTYDPASGDLTWKDRPREHFPTVHGWRIFQGKHAGKPVVAGERYVQVKLTHAGKQHLVYAHQVIWAMQTGEWPPRIDHRDRNKMNNRWLNLRLATHGQNMQNTSAKGDRGLPKGVIRSRNKYRANCGPTYIGVYETPEEAHAAYCAVAAARYGEFFSP
jgi:hypothetical protein